MAGQQLGQTDHEQQQSGGVAWVELAGLMLVMVGGFHLIQGVVALFRDQAVYIVGQQSLLVSVDYPTWGWIHPLVGIVVILVGAGLFSGSPVARILAVVVAFVSALVNVTFMPAFPLWSAATIAIDVLVVWAIIVHGGELPRPKA